MRRFAKPFLLLLTLITAMPPGLVAQEPASEEEKPESIPAAPDRAEGEGPFDRLLLRGAVLVDGTGAPARGPVDIVIAGNRIVERSYNPEGKTPAEVLDQAEQLIFEIAEHDASRVGGFTPLKNLLKQTIDKVEKLYATKNPVTGTATGFPDLDNMTAGLQPSDRQALS